MEYYNCKLKNHRNSQCYNKSYLEIATQNNFYKRYVIDIYKNNKGVQWKWDSEQLYKKNRYIPNNKKQTIY